jgi:hypothetical protein
LKKLERRRLVAAGKKLMVKRNENRRMPTHFFHYSIKQAILNIIHSTEKFSDKI